MSPWRFTDKACISACEKSGRWRSGIGETTTWKFCDLLQHCIRICCILFPHDGTRQKASKDQSHIEHKMCIVNASFQIFIFLIFSAFLGIAAYCFAGLVLAMRSSGLQPNTISAYPAVRCSPLEANAVGG